MDHRKNEGIHQKLESFLLYVRTGEVFDHTRKNLACQTCLNYKNKDKTTENYIEWSETT